MDRAVPARLTSTHWGVFEPVVVDGEVVEVLPFERDPAPSYLGASIRDGMLGDTRVRCPMVSESWLLRSPRRGPGRRGAGRFVQVSWAEALDLVAWELDRVRTCHGNTAIYAGSYGWASAGRFHHAQSQLRRFMNLLGGATTARGAYSFAAAQAVLPHVIGSTDGCVDGHSDWDTIIENTDMVLAFGGLPAKNAQVGSGGFGEHHTPGHLRRVAARGIRVVNVSPLRDDCPEELNAQWVPVVPGSDLALVLALCHTLVVEGLYDRDFTATRCVGFDEFRAYLVGAVDGVSKDARWAGAHTGVGAEDIVALARSLAGGRSMVMMAWALQRGENGESMCWAVVALACLIGQIGLPGGGFGIGYSAVNGPGNGRRRVRWPSLPQGLNPVTESIPVARIADALLDPGGRYEYGGRKHTYPDIRLVYWAGGNPFHHHQDLGRLAEAFQRPETVVVHDLHWTATAKHADIVLPVASALERNDLGASGRDNYLIAMAQALPALASSRTDFDIFTELAGRLGFGDAFTEGRDEKAWLRHLYGRFQESVDFPTPSFSEFWRRGWLSVPDEPADTVLFGQFISDPGGAPLNTPSGRIELFSQTVAGFGYPEIPGRAHWREPTEWLNGPGATTYPLHLISNQPATRLHSQLDAGSVSAAAKIRNREPIRLNPGDASARGISPGDVVLVRNERGSCFAGAVLDDAVRQGVVHLATGAWFDPVDPATAGSPCAHGNPNVLTLDKGTTRLGQAPIAMSCLVEVERFDAEPPAVRAWLPPPPADRGVRLADAIAARLNEGPSRPLTSSTTD
ncbi:putative biotin sulfoxide reductase BisC [Acrocarpospora pleiomorpha]|uniref:Putative biotin sulfoxide reductase BisC n=1 Tax=Acrocarpospora pleiomorpha TaxID=90975 RepID=A0A5M3XEI9_9ACTN|nr:molybdopterin-dependent oxidoreductase [Acrocarpospora pleiomorpha]GES17343.1 putative biotin sulfoxide reductase BisC [Acrocarpospora pleiomorpha]